MKENQEKNNFTVKKFEESIENVHFIKKNSSFFFILFVKAQENRASWTIENWESECIIGRILWSRGYGPMEKQLFDDAIDFKI